MTESDRIDYFASFDFKGIKQNIRPNCARPNKLFSQENETARNLLLRRRFSRPRTFPLYFYRINLFKFGKDGNASAARCARKNGAPTLLVHGNKDSIVTPTKAVYYIKNILEEREIK